MEELRAYGEYIVLALLLVEWFLGNTKLVSANSTIESVLNVIAKFLRLLKPSDK